MKRLLGVVFKHGTALSWAFMALAWLPLLYVHFFVDDTWGKLFLIFAVLQLSLVWSALGGLLGGLTAVRLQKKRWAVIACAANLASLVLLLLTASS